MLKKNVLQAEPYVEQALSSTGKADGMLIRQYRFPQAYDVREEFLSVRHDSLRFPNPERVDAILASYRTGGAVHVGTWARRQTDEHLFAFVKELADPEDTMAWTGFRILGTIQRNGYPFWTLELFLKLPGLTTPVYTGDDAPNVLTAPRPKR